MVTYPTRNHEDAGPTPELVQGVKGSSFTTELWCRSQTQLRSGISVAVAQASSCISNLTSSLGTYICHQCGPKKKKKKSDNVMILGVSNDGMDVFDKLREYSLVNEQIDWPNSESHY